MTHIFSQLRSRRFPLRWKQGVCVAAGILLCFVFWHQQTATPAAPKWIDGQNELHRSPTSSRATLPRRSSPLETERDSRIGWELFDHHTWVQGDHELQIREMRALKSQLEYDLLTFEPIEEARITLDLGRNELGEHRASKASVILTLAPYISHYQVPAEAITQHLCGAVPGLTPDHIAISDSQGYVYQMIGGSPTPSLWNEQEDFRSQMIPFAKTLCGDTTLVSVYGKESWNCHLWIPAYVPDKVQRSLSRHMEQLATVYGHPIKIEIERLPPSSTDPRPAYHLFSFGVGALFYGGIVCITAGLLLYWLWMQWKQKKKQVGHAVPAVDLQVLAASLKGEDPKILASMISYLETERAEEILAAFPETLQNAILKELEKRR